MRCVCSSQCWCREPDVEVALSAEVERLRGALELVQSSRYSTAISSFVIPAETMRDVDRALKGETDGN